MGYFEHDLKFNFEFLEKDESLKLEKKSISLNSGGINALQSESNINIDEEMKAAVEKELLQMVTKSMCEKLSKSNKIDVIKFEKDLLSFNHEDADKVIEKVFGMNCDYIVTSGSLASALQDSTNFNINYGSGDISSQLNSTFSEIGSITRGPRTVKIYVDHFMRWNDNICFGFNKIRYNLVLNGPKLINQATSSPRLLVDFEESFITENSVSLFVLTNDDNDLINRYKGIKRKLNMDKLF